MSETRARRQDRRTAVTTSAILDAADRLFVERGFHAVTMDAIADAADLAVGSIYHHFKNKERLNLGLVERALAVNEEAMARTFGEGRTPMEELRAASDAYCDFHLQNPGYFRMMALRTLDVPPGDMADGVERRISRPWLGLYPVTGPPRRWSPSATTKSPTRLVAEHVRTHP